MNVYGYEARAAFIYCSDKETIAQGRDRDREVYYLRWLLFFTVVFEFSNRGGDKFLCTRTLKFLRGPSEVILSISRVASRRDEKLCSYGWLVIKTKFLQKVTADFLFIVFKFHQENAARITESSSGYPILATLKAS